MCVRVRVVRVRARSSSAPAAEAEIVDDVSHVSILAAMLGVEDGLSHFHVGGLATPAMKVPARIGARRSANGPGGPGASGAPRRCTHSPWGAIYGSASQNTNSPKSPAPGITASSPSHTS